MSAVADKPVDYYAVVKYTADEDAENNTTENISVAPKLSNLPKVTDLKGEDTAEGVKLTWSEPDLSNAPADLTLVGYDIYRDGVKINDEPVGETEYVDTDAADGEHSYVVITVYDRGASAPSNAVTLAATGINDALAAGISISAGKGTITVAGAEGQTLSVAAVDGKVVYTATAAARTTVNVAAGVYVVKAGNKIVKVAVK